MLKLFYVTDIHGSNVCYRKFLNALPIYGVDVAVLNGDLLGKVLVPLVEKAGGGRECHLMGQYTAMSSAEEIAATKKTIENAGYYWVEQTREEYEAHQERPGGHRRAVQEAGDRAHRGVAGASRRAAGRQEHRGLHLPGQRRLVGDRRHDRPVEDVCSPATTWWWSSRTTGCCRRRAPTPLPGTRRARSPKDELTEHLEAAVPARSAPHPRTSRT